MNLDRDLRDALQPLAGDPVADARRVLAALPAVPPGGGGRPFPPTAWGLGTVGLLLGLLVGVGVTAWHRAPTPATTAPAAAPTTPERPGQAPAPPKPWQDPQKRERPPDFDPDFLVVMAFAELRVDKPGEGVQDLKPDVAWHVRVGTTFTTGDGPAGIHVLADDRRVRLDSATQARIGVDRSEFRRGRMWVSSMSGTSQLDTALATVQLDGNTDLMVSGDEQALTFLGLRGTALVRTKDSETLRVGERQELQLERQRGASPLREVGFTATATSWMTRMIVLQQDPTELSERVLYLVDAWQQGRHRDAAALEIRRLGPRCVPMLAYGAEARLADPAYVQDVARLTADLVDYDSARWLFGLLAKADPEARMVLFRGIRRATGTAEGDETFWREAEPQERERAVARWRALLQR